MLIKTDEVCVCVCVCPHVIYVCVNRMGCGRSKGTHREEKAKDKCLTFLMGSLGTGTTGKNPRCFGEGFVLESYLHASEVAFSGR